jgi:tol-pal system protein YbgF
MTRLIPTFAIFLASLLLLPQAHGQRAQVQRGYTSTDLAGTVNELRQRNADMDLDIARLEDQIAQLNGKVETLEFLLSQSRDEANRMQGDDKRIGESLRSLADTNERLERRLAGLEEDIDQIASGQVAGNDAENDGGQNVQAAASERSGSDESQQASISDQDSERSVADSTGNDGDAPQQAGPDYQGSLGTLQASNLPGEAGPLFAAAKSRLLKFDYAGAEDAFRAFLARFSDDPQAGEAQYWLAETLFQQEAYNESGEAYLEMIREYPRDARAPDALVKLARSMRLVGDTDRACEALSVLPQQYPNASGVTKNLAKLERTRTGCGT